MAYQASLEFVDGLTLCQNRDAGLQASNYSTTGDGQICFVLHKDRYSSRCAMMNAQRFLTRSMKDKL